MRYLLTCFLFVFAILIDGPVSAQRIRYIDTSLGLGYQALRDKGMSPLLYGGPTIGGAISYFRVSASSYKRVDFSFNEGAMQNKAGTNLNLFEGSIKTQGFYTSGVDSVLSMLSWGWVNQNTFSFRKNLGYVNYHERINYITSFGPACMFSYPFTIKSSKIFISTVFHAQVFGFFLRPSYTTNEPKGYLTPDVSLVNGFFKSIELFYPGKALSFGAKPQVTLALRSGNMLNLLYEYDYVWLGGEQAFRSSNGIWRLSWTMRLTRFY